MPFARTRIAKNQSQSPIRKDAIEWDLQNHAPLEKRMADAKQARLARARLVGAAPSYASLLS